MPVRAGKTSFSKEKNGPSHFIKAVVSEYRGALVHATDHTHGPYRFVEIALVKGNQPLGFVLYTPSNSAERLIPSLALTSWHCAASNMFF